MKKIVVTLAIVCFMGMNELWSVRDMRTWENQNLPIYGLIPYYKRNNEVWIVLKNYTYNNGQKGLSAAVEYINSDLDNLGFNFFESQEAFEQQIKRVGINNNIQQIGSSRRGATYNLFYFIEINEADRAKIGNIKKEDGTFESIKFSDLYNAQCEEAQSGLLTQCKVAGKNILFLNSFAASFLDHRTLNNIKNKLNIASVPVQTQVPPQPTSTPTRPVVTTSTQPTTVTAVQSSLQELSARLDELSKKI